jgi:hypothetical protein
MGVVHERMWMTCLRWEQGRCTARRVENENEQAFPPKKLDSVRKLLPPPLPTAPAIPATPADTQQAAATYHTDEWTATTQIHPWANRTQARLSLSSP